MPANQRDLAEILGIRRDSLRKLRRHTRKSMIAEARELPKLGRTRKSVASFRSLSDITV